MADFAGTSTGIPAFSVWDDWGWGGWGVLAAQTVSDAAASPPSPVSPAAAAAASRFAKFLFICGNENNFFSLRCKKLPFIATVSSFNGLEPAPFFGQGQALSL
jgi:hypothetical protein